MLNKTMVESQMSRSSAQNNYRSVKLGLQMER